MAAEDFIISRKRKKYRFALFAENALCFELEQWQPPQASKPLTLELGAGTALFSVELARRHPDRQFLAQDVKADRLQKGAQLAAELGLPNIQFVRAHAALLATMLPEASLSDIWLTFPDPHPKKRAIKHRLTSHIFLRLYRNLLKNDASLRFKTDNHALFDWSLEELVTEGWHIHELSYDLQASLLAADYKILTTYETRFAAEGLPTLYLAAN